MWSGRNLYWFKYVGAMWVFVQCTEVLAFTNGHFMSSDMFPALKVLMSCMFISYICAGLLINAMSAYGPHTFLLPVMQQMLMMVSGGEG